MNRRLTPLTVLALLASACSPDPFITGDGGVGPAPMCNAYEYRGTTYDCDALDRCTETDITYRLACCECDPRLCNPDPDCGDGGIAPRVEAALAEVPTRSGARSFLRAAMTESAVMRPVLGLSVGMFSIDIEKEALSESTSM